MCKPTRLINRQPRTDVKQSDCCKTNTLQLRFCNYVIASKTKKSKRHIICIHCFIVRYLEQKMCTHILKLINYLIIFQSSEIHKKNMWPGRLTHLIMCAHTYRCNVCNVNVKILVSNMYQTILIRGTAKC